ncbi:Druantia anti-phage system protein DruA [Bathymodiolus platifrons methanotrophic gill symbiont]|uniref:Druantia anti-phage system protein DruA n=1 Tax=Bathymodiolus platifrons methanotrophic gill symbiont TaxID=113268 RepID=UPI001C8D25CD|nr:Druantia anti-phage system protein DruA [Bathymodiolus platifrons methanotrophic gill symbiont]
MTGRRHRISSGIDRDLCRDSQYLGTCYQAANWECIGKSSGKDWQDKVDENNRSGSVKSIWVTPLHKHFRAILKNQQPAKAQVDLDESFVNLWGKVVMIISDVAQEFVCKMAEAQTCIDSLLLVFLIFRLVFSKNSQGYGTTIEESVAQIASNEVPFTSKENPFLPRLFRMPVKNWMKISLRF